MYEPDERYEILSSEIYRYDKIKNKTARDLVAHLNELDRIVAGVHKYEIIKADREYPRRRLRGDDTYFIVDDGSDIAFALGQKNAQRIIDALAYYDKRQEATSDAG